MIYNRRGSGEWCSFIFIALAELVTADPPTHVLDAGCARQQHGYPAATTDGCSASHGQQQALNPPATRTRGKFTSSPHSIRKNPF